ncbi:MAG: glucosylglycerol hydrolase [Pseudomonadota bacterium]
MNIMQSAASVSRNDAATDALIEFVREEMAGAETSFDAARAIARRLGAQKNGAVCEVGFWAPELLENRVPDGDIFLEVLEAEEPLHLTTARQQVRFRRHRLPMARHDAYAFVAVEGMTAGDRETLGSFYALAWRDAEGEWRRVLDPLSASLPFGAFAPAEYYDVAAMQAARGDRAYFEALGGTAEAPVKIGPAASILQIHVPTATAGRTLASLTRHLEHVAERVDRDLPLEAGDRLFAGYEAIQLLPVEPTTVYEGGPDFWTEEAGDADDVLSVDLRRPDTTNWGYDVVIAGMAAVNPALLESGRPDELVDLASVLHNWPKKPKRLIIDVVYGHADNQGLDALNSHFFAGPNMYGQNINYRNWTVRAILLEMQRRKVDFGADGVRVDGAQDFKWWDSQAEQNRHDDEYLQSMSDVVQEVGGAHYRPWFIFEDGRPWPQEDWELSSTYRAVIEAQRDNDVFQWGPLTFAHNTPFLYTFWLSKWWRIREILEHGENWISGCANHDTLRRGTQINPKLNINTRLGETRMDILDKAYDNPGVNLVTYGALPGVPMDFLNASARASWGFIRNQDDRYGVKVVAEEAISLKWQVDEYAYSMPAAFRRLKEMGFETRAALARFLEFLPALVEVTEYDLDVIAKLLNEVDPPLEGPHPYTVPVLKEIARAWMDDMHDYCNVSAYQDLLSDAQTGFNLTLRRFRGARPWLRRNLGPGDYFDYCRPVDGTALFTALRNGPSGEQVFTVAHLEGGPVHEVEPTALGVPGTEGDGWQVALRTPPIGEDYLGGPLTLKDSMGLLFVR